MQLRTLVLAGCAILLCATTASAYSIAGRVTCLADGSPLAGIVVVASDSGPGGATASALTDEQGFYMVSPGPGTFDVFIDPTSLPGPVDSPASGVHVVVLDLDDPFQDGKNFVVDDPACAPELGACWMTAGGVKFESVTGTRSAEHGPRDSFGGNVYPSCSPEPGDGGQWNHVAHSLKLHFLGRSIRVVRCGNVDDPDVPPGSESPVTPFNFIEFEGEGTLSGIHGSRFPTTDVMFFARVEDRNEPGSEGPAEGEDIDRYYLEVVDASGVTHILVDETPEDGTVDPVTITGGNLQLHATSCDD